MARVAGKVLGRQQPVAEQIAEMAALEALQRQRGLSDAESERLGELVLREQRRARYRPARLAKPRRELELLERLELAEKGAAGLPVAVPGEVELVRDADGQWRADERKAA